jgi:hypothetical protein
MITASEARKQANSFIKPTPKPRKWNIFDTCQLKTIEKSIKSCSAQGKMSTQIYAFMGPYKIRPLVAEELKKNGYKVKNNGAPSCSWLDVSWKESSW